MGSRRVIALLSVLVVAGCSSTSHTTPAAPAQQPVTAAQPTTTYKITSPPANTTQHHSGPHHRQLRTAAGCITKSGYGGLYAPVGTFKAHNNMNAPSTVILGDAWDTILSTQHGCVTGYSVDEIASPPLGARDMLLLVDGINLPGFPPTFTNTNTCEVWASPVLARASGFKYAVGTSTAQQGTGGPGHAEIHLSNSPSC